MPICDYTAPTLQQVRCAAAGAIDNYRTGKWDRKTTITYGLILAGYIADRFVPTGVVNAHYKMADEEAIALLEPLAADPDTAELKLADWQKLIPLVRFFLDFIERKP